MNAHCSALLTVLSCDLLRWGLTHDSLAFEFDAVKHDAQSPRVRHVRRPSYVVYVQVLLAKLVRLPADLNNA